MKQSLINIALLGLMGLIYADLLLRERWLRASIEIRPDCMILDDADVFWRRHMDLGWPALGYDIEAEAVTLSGVYGTRRVTYVVLHPVDENDCTVQVLGAQLKLAFEQLWDKPEA